MVENGWKLHLDDDLDFVSKSDKLLVLLLGDNLGDAMLWLAAYPAASADRRGASQYRGSCPRGYLDHSTRPAKCLANARASSAILI
jgi:hypothetical protein